MAQGSFGSHGIITYALSAGILFRVQRSVDGNGTNRKRGVKRGNNLTKGEHATTGKRLHLQQQCNFLPPVEASGTIAAIPLAPSAPNLPINDNLNGVVMEATAVEISQPLQDPELFHWHQIRLLFPFNHWHQHSLVIMLIKIPHQDLKIYCRYQNSLLFLFKMMLL